MSCSSCPQKRPPPAYQGGAPQPFRAGDDETTEGDDADRDARTLNYAIRKGSGRERSAPPTTGGRQLAWGGSLRRMAEAGVAPSREDEHRFTTVPGRYVPVGFARYVSPVVQAADYAYYRVAGWRVAVPRVTPGERVRDLLYRIFYFGPQSAGYVRLGETLVPAILEPGDRATLAGTAVEYYDLPLSP